MTTSTTVTTTTTNTTTTRLRRRLRRRILLLRLALLLLLLLLLLPLLLLPLLLLLLLLLLYCYHYTTLASLQYSPYRHSALPSRITSYMACAILARLALYDAKLNTLASLSERAPQASVAKSARELRVAFQSPRQDCH